MKNTVKVLTTWAGRRVNGIGYPELSGPIDAISMLRYSLEQDKERDYGTNMDLVIVNARPNKQNFDNDPTLMGKSGLKAYNSYLSYLDSIDGEKTKNGRVTVLHRNNEGLSFGSYNRAYQIYKDQYDYWFFCEDDTIPILENLMAVSIKHLEENESTGFVSLCTNRATNRGHGYRRRLNVTRFAWGGIGIMSKEKVDFIIKKWDHNGELPVYRDKNPAKQFIFARGVRGEDQPRQHDPYRYEGDGRDACLLQELFFTGLLSPEYQITRINSIRPFDRGTNAYIRWRRVGGEKITSQMDVRSQSWSKEMIRF